MNGIGWVVKELWNNQRIVPSRLERKNMYLELKFLILQIRRCITLCLFMRTVTGDLVPWALFQTDCLQVIGDCAVKDEIELEKEIERKRSKCAAT